MKNKLFVLIIIAIGFISCKKDKELTHDSIDKQAKNIQRRKCQTTADHPGDWKACQSLPKYLHPRRGCDQGNLRPNQSG